VVEAAVRAAVEVPAAGVEAAPPAVMLLRRASSLGRCVRAWRRGEGSIGENDMWAHFLGAY
jgi:hypothetical protein